MPWPGLSRVDTTKERIPGLEHFFIETSKTENKTEKKKVKKITEYPLQVRQLQKVYVRCKTKDPGGLENAKQDKCQKYSS